MPSWNRLDIEPKETVSPVTATSGGEIVMNIADQDQFYSHNFLSIEFFSDSLGTSPVTPSAGVVRLKAKLKGSPVFLEANNGSFNAGDIGVGDFGGNPVSVKAEFTDLAGADYARITLNSNNT